jgi:hypothetical protein
MAPERILADQVLEGHRRQGYRNDLRLPMAIIAVPVFSGMPVVVVRMF